MSVQETIDRLQRHPDAIRNVCILAHVDHGKTSLSDHLISANGIISSRVAGQVRYLDSREDEQERCITMKSSSISLSYRDHLINLIDSPGHIDFSSEVSTATRLCDGALVLVDIVEGIQVQTQSVLRQAWDEGVTPVLILNKMDRLILELKMSPVEAYHRCRQVIEQANALVSSMHMADLMAKSTDTDHLDDDYDDEIVFGPERGNVVFASAMDGWALSIRDAAAFYARTLGMKEGALEKVLWGDFYFSPKTKTVSKKPSGTVTNPMFVQFVLNNIWQAYECLTATPIDQTKVEKLVKALNVNVLRRDLQSRDDRVRLQAVMRAWYPLAPAVLDLCLLHLPSPVKATGRLKRIWPGGLETAHEVLRSAAEQCSADPDAPVVVAITKMVAVTKEQLDHRLRKPRFERRPYRRPEERQQIAPDVAPEQAPEAAADDNESDGDDDRQHFVGLARVFAGRLRSDLGLYVYLPRYRNDNDVDEDDANTNFVYLEPGTIRLYTFMGVDLEPITEAYAGHVVAIAGIDEHVLSAATLSTELQIAPFKLLRFASSPIVRVAIEPARTSDLAALSNGLRLLAHADPNIEVVHHRSGQIHLVTSGELHLERCIRDLNDRFAPGIALRVSPPVIPFRETITQEASLDGQTRDLSISFTVKIRPMPWEFAQSLDTAEVVRQLRQADGFEKLKVKAGNDLQENVAAFGPARATANVLAIGYPPESSTEAVNRAIIGGFQTAVSAGTLCEEPMMGVLVVVQQISLADVSNIDEGELDRQVRAAIKTAIRSAFDEASPRLVEPMYKVQLQCTSNQLGNLCNALARRRGRTTRDDMIEGTDIFEVDAFVPVEASMGLSHDLRSRTSGSAAPQLLFSHWEVIAQDPNWIPTTADELEEFGSNATKIVNFARELVDKVRRRKGLPVKQHLVEFAEKQNTARHS